MNGIGFFNTLSVTIVLDRLECIKEFDQDGHSEPYIWPAFVRADASTLQDPDGPVEVLVPFEGESGRGLFGDAGKGVKPGDVIQIPASLGRRVTTVETFKLGEQEIMSVGFVLVLLEQDSTPSDAMKAGHQEFGPALREEINEIVLQNLGPPDDDQIEVIKDNVSKRVKKAVKSKLSWYHAFSKQDDFLGFLGGKDTLFGAKRIRGWRGKGPQAFRAQIEGTETFKGLGGTPIFVGEHLYDLFWHIEVVEVDHPVVAPVLLPLVARVEKAGTAVHDLDVRIHGLFSALASANDQKRPALLSQLEENVKRTRPQAVRELATVWSEFIRARSDEESEKPDSY